MRINLYQIPKVKSFKKVSGIFHSYMTPPPQSEQKISKENGAFKLIRKFFKDDCAKIELSLKRRKSGAHFKETLDNELKSTDKKEQGGLIKVALYLINAKTKDGHFIFNAENSNSLDTFVNYMDKFRQDKKEFQNMIDLLDFVKRGELSIDFISEIKRNQKISPKLLESIKKFKKKEEFVISYKSKKEGMKKSKEGDVFNIKDQLYMKCENYPCEISLSKKTFLGLFQPHKMYALRQTMGNCYFVSALRAMMEKPKTFLNILNSFQEKGNDIIVRIGDMYRSPIVFKDKKINSLSALEGPPGFQMIEEAYGRTRTIRHGLNYTEEVAEGGASHCVFNALSGKKNSQTYYLFFDNNGNSEFNYYKMALGKNFPQLSEKRNIALQTNNIETYEEYIENNKQIRTFKDSMEYFIQREPNVLGDIEDIIKSNLKNKNILCIATTNFNESKHPHIPLLSNHEYFLNGINQAGELILTDPHNTALVSIVSLEKIKNYISFLDMLPTHI